MLKLLSTAKEKYLLKKIVRFDKRKHKKATWMTNGLSKSVITKDSLYKKLIRTNIEGSQLVILKNEFANFKNTLRRSINTVALYKKMT